VVAEAVTRAEGTVWKAVFGPNRRIGDMSAAALTRTDPCPGNVTAQFTSERLSSTGSGTVPYWLTSPSTSSGTRLRSSLYDSSPPQARFNWARFAAVCPRPGPAARKRPTIHEEQTRKPYEQRLATPPRTLGHWNPL
jgi:hypothetical protein